jgi:hypothetical protein
MDVQPDYTAITNLFLQQNVTGGNITDVRTLVIFSGGEYIKSVQDSRQIEGGFTWISTNRSEDDKPITFDCITNGIDIRRIVVYAANRPSRIDMDPIHGRRCFRLRELNQLLYNQTYRDGTNRQYGHFHLFMIEEERYYPPPIVKILKPPVNWRIPSAAYITASQSTINQVAIQKEDSIEQIKSNDQESVIVSKDDNEKYVTEEEEREIYRQELEKAKKESEDQWRRNREKALEECRANAIIAAKEKYSKPTRPDNNSNNRK